MAELRDSQWLVLADQLSRWRWETKWILGVRCTVRHTLGGMLNLRGVWRRALVCGDAPAMSKREHVGCCLALPGQICSQLEVLQMRRLRRLWHSSSEILQMGKYDSAK